MLKSVKQYIQDRASDLFIILVIFLVALISFGIGRITASNNEPIQINNLEKTSQENLKSLEKERVSEQTDYRGKVVASKNSDKYHLPDCPGAKQISEQNKIWFNSIEEAKRAGYEPAGNCPGLK